MGHFVLKCKDCGKVIAQCRCPGPKPVKYGICPDCLRRSG